MARQLAPLEQAFWSKVDRRGDDECWPWTGSRNRQGYARLSRQGRDIPASRIAWALANGRAFPAELSALHRCDNPACVNPAHIWPGTQAENIADMVAKGRHGRLGRELTPSRCIRCGHKRDDDFLWRGKARRCRACKKAYDAAREAKKREYDRANQPRQTELLRQRRAARREQSQFQTQEQS